MECNKDEALRAKAIAEKKMHGNDFDGARRIALKAQHLFPELENISQLLTVCNVHCSAESKILGSEKDWYSILQVDRMADETAVRKQYRKLALALHPDKNKFPGAEAAFKLIGEAHRVLSDRAKRSLYDSKVGVALKSVQVRQPSHKVNLNPPAWKQSTAQHNAVNPPAWKQSTAQHNAVNPPAWKQSTAQHNAANGFSSQFSGPNPHQTMECKSRGIMESFWTCCPNCKRKYQFYREVQNKMLRCQKCSQTYMSYEIPADKTVPGSNQSQAAQGVSPGFNQSQPSVFKQKADLKGTFGTSGLKTGGSMAANLGPRVNASSVGSVSGSEMRSNIRVGLDRKTKDGEEGCAQPKGAKLPNEAADFRNTKRKRGRKSQPEPSESFDSSDSSSMEDIEMETSTGPTAGVNSGVSASVFVRRSHRQKQQVSYGENGADDDFESPPKRSRKEETCGEGRPEGIVNDKPQFAKPTGQKEKITSPGLSAQEKSKICRNQTGGRTAFAPNRVDEEFEVSDISESDDDSCEPFFVPEPEFNDFDKFKEESSFAVDQFWACYDDNGMPRFYAQIRKVYGTPFRVRFTWLEPAPDDKGEIDWAMGGLPVVCGKFRRGDPQDETNLCVFSHQIICEKGKGKQRGTFMVYPRKGETWALYKDWDIRWSTDPVNLKQCKYEIVEVISDFVEGAGVEVAFLERLNGFVSLFQQRSQNPADSILIPPTEMLKFSHRIPSFRMIGTEKEGVPEGCFELDPAGLPLNTDDVCYPSIPRVENATSEADCSDHKPKLYETETTPKKPKDPVRENGVGGKSCKVRRSPRRLNIAEKRHTAYHSSTGMETSGYVNGEESKGEFSPSKVSTFQADKNVDGEKVSTPSKRDGIQHFLSPVRKVLEDLLNDCKEDRSAGIFKVHQIWALYEPGQKLPKLYGQIKRIEQSPLKLYVAPLELVSPPKNGRQTACGAFKVRNGKPRMFEPCFFSHLLEAEVNSKNRVEIYPKVGEVWVLYRNWNAELKSSELKNCECEVVEIIGVSEGRTKVSPLTLLTWKSNKLVLRPSRKQRSSSLETIEVEENELGRFSHRAPASVVTAQKGGSLAGCFVVDAAAVPTSLLKKMKVA